MFALGVPASVAGLLTQNGPISFSPLEIRNADEGTEQWGLRVSQVGLRLGSLGAALFCHWVRLQRKTDKMHRETQRQKRENVSLAPGPGPSQGAVFSCRWVPGDILEPCKPLFSLKQLGLGWSLSIKSTAWNNGARAPHELGIGLGRTRAFRVGVCAGHTGSGREVRS